MMVQNASKIRRRLTGLAVIVLVSLLGVMGQNAMAAHQLARDQSGSFEMEPTALAGGATARINDITVSPDPGDDRRDDFDDHDRRDDFDDHDRDDDFDDHDRDDDFDDHDRDDDFDDDFDDDHNGNDHNGNGSGQENGHNGNGSGQENGHNGNGTHGSLSGPQNESGVRRVQNDSAFDHRQVSGTISVNGLADTQRVVAFLVDNEGGRSVRLGDLTAGGTDQLELRFSVSAENVPDFDRVVITREPENDPDPLPSPDVLFQKPLPHE